MAQATKSTSSKPRTRSTTSRATAARKAATPKAAAKPAAAAKTALPKTRSTAAEAAAPVIVEDLAPATDLLELKKQELIELAVERSGVKKRDAKPAIEAALEILGEALGEGRDLNLRPMGKVKVTRRKQLSNARVMVCKVRQVQQVEEDVKEPLADAAE